MRKTKSLLLVIALNVKIDNNGFHYHHSKEKIYKDRFIGNYMFVEFFSWYKDTHGSKHFPVIIITYKPIFLKAIIV